jgi:hypothetical protein
MSSLLAPGPRAGVSRILDTRGVTVAVLSERLVRQPNLAVAQLGNPAG